MLVIWVVLILELLVCVRDIVLPRVRDRLVVANVRIVS